MRGLDRRLTVAGLVAILLAVLVVGGCLGARAEWRHQRFDVLPEMRRQIDNAYIDKRTTAEQDVQLNKMLNLYREALVSWGRALQSNNGPVVERAEALRLLALVRTMLREMRDGDEPSNGGPDCEPGHSAPRPSDTARGV